MRNRLREAIITTVAGLVGLGLLTAYYVVSGYSLDRTLDWSNPGGIVYYCFAVGLLCAGTLFAWRRNVRVVAVGATAALLSMPLLVPPTFPAYLTELTTELTILTAVFLVGGIGEYALRNPSAIRDTFTPTDARVGFFAGMGHVVCVFAVDSWFGPAAYFRTLGNIALTAWILAGVIIVGATVGILFVHFRFVAPILFVAGTFIGTTYLTWNYYHELGNATPVAAFTAFGLYQVAWLSVLALALGLAAIEYLLRNQFERRGVWRSA